MNNPGIVNLSSAECASDSEDARMFELAPVSLWLEDYSSLETLFEEWRSTGVADLCAYLSQDLERVRLCASRLRIVKVNQKTLALYEVADVEELIANIGGILRDDMPAATNSPSSCSIRTGRRAKRCSRTFIASPSSRVSTPGLRPRP
jgi:hypothetical protein